MQIAIITDIHEDIRSLRKIMSRIEKTGYDMLVCLGDISGFSVPYYGYLKTRNAHDCLALLREKEAIIVPGNHDLFAAKIIPKESGSFIFPDTWYEMDYKTRAELGKDEIWLHEENDLDPLYTDEDIAFIRSLPEYYVLNNQPSNILLSHYAWPNLTGFRKGFFSREEEFRPHFEFMERQNCSISFTGHVHIRGFYTARPGHFRQYRRRNITMEEFPVCIGIHPVTNNGSRNGYCIFDAERSYLRTIRC